MDKLDYLIANGLIRLYSPELESTELITEANKNTNKAYEFTELTLTPTTSCSMWATFIHANNDSATGARLSHSHPDLILGSNFIGFNDGANYRKNATYEFYLVNILQNSESLWYINGNE